MKRFLEKANWITLTLCVGVIQVSAYYLQAVTLRPDVPLAVTQPDSSLYFQAARRIVEGGAFTFSSGGGVSTGTTSVLYPFVLAVPYVLGFTGDALPLAGFLLNALFYLVFLGSWALVIDAKVREPAAKVVSALLLALFGQFAYVSLAQSDIGLWLAVSSLFALGLALDRTWLSGTMLLIGPWVRPEGMVCCTAFALVACVVRRNRGLAALGLLSLLGVFLFNHGLTGSWQFSSVQGKGHFATEPFHQAVVSSFRDAVSMLRQLTLGQASGTFREMLFFPVLGAVCLWYHVFRRDYSDFDSREAVFLLATAGGFATVAMSGWQGTNFDRYLAWMMPVVVIWTACGAMELGARLKGPARVLPASLVLGFGLVGSIVEAECFRLDCEWTEIPRAFFQRCEATLPKSVSLGAFGNASCAYWLSARRFSHLNGIYSPEYKASSLVSVFEILKHEPSLRFDYWLYDATIEGEIVADASRAVFGESVLLGPSGLELRKVDWQAFDAAAAIPAAPVAGVRLRDCLDIGYEVHERAADYSAWDAFSQRTLEPFFRLDTLDGRTFAEVGRVVTGGDEMTVRGLEAGKDLFVVMRTTFRQSAERLGPTGRRTDNYAFSASQRLQVFVDGADAGTISYRVPDKDFADISFRIPGEALAAQTVRITLAGEHISCGYWFYQ